MSVILRGMPLDRTGTVGAACFLILFAASAAFCKSSALIAAALGFLFKLKCLIAIGYKQNQNNRIINLIQIVPMTPIQLVF